MFVPNGASRQQTAILLVGTAEEHGISTRTIKCVSGGFLITEALHALVYSDTKKTSGNRAAKNSTT